MRNKLWPKKKISWLFDVIGSGTTPSASNEMYYDSPDMAWLNTGDLTDSYIEKTSKYVSQQALDKFSALTVFPKDSLVMAMYGATIGKLGITKYETTTNQACCVLSKPRGVITKFIFYWLMGHRTEIINLSHGGGQPNISQGIIRNIRIAVPPVDLQSKIVTFVDKKFEETNQLINKKEKMIKLLEQQRQSIITEAVTKGLNPNVKMKDSGVEWIGEIPEHWEVSKFKYLGKLVNGYPFPSNEFSSSGVRVMKINNIQNMRLDWNDESFIDESYFIKLKQFRIQKNDLVFALTRPIISTGIKAAIVDIDEPILLNQRNAYFRSGKKICSSWLYYLMLNKNFVQEFESLIDRTGQQPNISSIDIENIKLPIPPVLEQEVIINHLNHEGFKVEKTVTNLKNQIKKLKEYRQSLIYEAVTGKIDVRDMELY